MQLPAPQPDDTLDRLQTLLNDLTSEMEKRSLIEHDITIKRQQELRELDDLKSGIQGRRERGVVGSRMMFPGV
jgi:hypothetical protein